MKRGSILVAILIASVLALAGGCNGGEDKKEADALPPDLQQAAPEEHYSDRSRDELEAMADEFVDFLVAGDYAACVAKFEEIMTRAMQEEKLRESWERLQRGVGDYKERLGVKVTRQQGFDVVYVPTQFEKRLMNIKIVYDEDGAVSGLWFERAEK